MKQRNLIIDTDPGIDDALAIMLVQASGVFDIRAITSVYGNSSLNNTSRNALFLADLYDIDCKVAVGAQGPIIRSIPVDVARNGKNGLADIRYPQPKQNLHDRWAWELIYNTAIECEGELELLTLGPLTNIAIALLKYPSLKDMIKKIVVMGGTVSSGKTTISAMNNIRQDPHAASVVFSAGFPNLVLVDLECCMGGYLTDSECDRMLILKSKLGPVYEELRKYQRKYQREEIETNPALEPILKDKNIYCDLIAAAVAINSDITDYKQYYVTCETQSEVNYGQTIVDWYGRLNQVSNVFLARNIDRNLLSDMFFGSFDFYSEQNRNTDEGVK
ncbi:MAG: nucleoside hydrolase [Oscillospiraceae bacterium]|nr:nucleoside hydrolase [Oscillospiraceae bacterium]